MMRAARRRRSRRSPEQALAAVKESRSKYESSRKGKKRRSKWVDANRDAVNEYKRNWRKKRREERLQAIPLADF